MPPPPARNAMPRRPAPSRPGPGKPSCTSRCRGPAPAAMRIPTSSRWAAIAACATAWIPSSRRRASTTGAPVSRCRRSMKRSACRQCHPARATTSGGKTTTAVQYAGTTRSCRECHKDFDHSPHRLSPDRQPRRPGMQRLPQRQDPEHAQGRERQGAGTHMHGLPQIAPPRAESRIAGSATLSIPGRWSHGKTHAAAPGKNSVAGLAVFAILFWAAALRRLPAAQKAGAFFFRGTLYQDWMGFKNGGENFYSRLSTRLDLELWNRPGNGWTIFLDARDRFAAGEGGGNQLILYEARLAYDSPRSRLFFSLGQMNLYDTAGIGQLAGVLAGFKFGRYLSAGAYGGLATDLYAESLSLGLPEIRLLRPLYRPGREAVLAELQPGPFQGPERAAVHLFQPAAAPGPNHGPLRQRRVRAGRPCRPVRPPVAPVRQRPGEPDPFRRPYGELQFRPGHGLPPLSPRAIPGPRFRQQ